MKGLVLMISMVSTRHWNRLKLSIATALTAVLVVLGIGVAPTHAATLDGMLAFNGFHVGAFKSSDGSLAYCLEPGADAPFSTQLGPTVVSSLPGYSVNAQDGWGWSGKVATATASGEVLRQLNWVLAEHAPGASPEQAVAVQIALWELRRGPGNAAWLDEKYKLIRDHGGASFVQAGLKLAERAKTEAVGPGNRTPDAALIISAGEEHGSGTLSYPSGTTSLTITGGEFENGEQRMVLSDASAGSVKWSATLHDDEWARFHEVTIEGTWELEERYWPDQIVLHPSSDQTEQKLGSGVAAVTAKNGGEFDPVSITVDSQFTPAIETSVPELIVDRDTGSFADTVTVSASGESAPWPQRTTNGTYLPLTAQGTLYGPFNVPQEERDEAPAGSPVAARSTLKIDNGPGTYAVTAEATPSESGYYYWVWQIDEASQSRLVRDSELLPANGVFADRFGVDVEGHVVPTQLRWITALKERELQFGTKEQVLEDTIKVSMQRGAWLVDRTGERIPARIRVTAYQLDEEPSQQGEPPAEAKEIASVFADVTETETWIDVPPITIPEGTRGWVTVRACLLEEDQAESVRGHIESWCDDFGIPEETAVIVEPQEPKTQPRLAVTGFEPGQLALLAGAGVLTSGVLLFGLQGIIRRGARRREGQLFTTDL
ncbi:hypothetical protein [Leucobacter denitrificans]|uniref:Uncharacterized protein n=1 Tax=Leucobacter denitrificans TaxID=683042 RepID=A0A7G9S4W9_9MICO|nr:hypothetical protein [Leucobacter denitrificans]QNN62894.1 hypothetical protein H9L06_00405 [Leucobacter denitrificans]